MDSKKGSAKGRASLFNEIMDDLELISLSNYRTSQIEIVTEISAEAKEFSFEEYKGSLFYVLFNIVKNSHEALDLVPVERRSIRIHATVTDAGQLQISVNDSGCGMTEDQISSLLSGEGRTNKASGHGIGMRFVRSECEKNGFILAVPRSDSTGTEFRIIVPAKRAENL